MSRPQYTVKESYTGDGSLDEYTFDFKIENLAQLLVVVLDDDDVEVQRVRGDDTSFLDSVEFDSDLGGGTVTLIDNLPADYRMILLLANDEPTQPYEFRNKGSFTLRSFERALDFLAGVVQRLTFQAKTAIRFHDFEDEETVSGMLPYGIADNPGAGIFVNEDADGFEYGPTATEVANAQAYALAAQAAQAAAEAALASVEEFIPTFVEFNGPTSGTLQPGEFGILKSGSSFALTLGNTGLVAGSIIELKQLGFAGSSLTVTPSTGLIDGGAMKILMVSTNASYKFRYTGTEWITT